VELDGIVFFSNISYGQSWTFPRRGADSPQTYKTYGNFTGERGLRTSIDCKERQRIDRSRAKKLREYEIFCNENFELKISKEGNNEILWKIYVNKTDVEIVLEICSGS
jgi:hypothetical protein